MFERRLCIKYRREPVDEFCGLGGIPKGTFRFRKMVVSF